LVIGEVLIFTLNHSSTDMITLQLHEHIITIIARINFILIHGISQDDGQIRWLRISKFFLFNLNLEMNLLQGITLCYHGLAGRLGFLD